MSQMFRLGFLQGFYIVTIHFVDPAIGKLRCMLLNLFGPDPGDGVGKRLSIMLFDFLSSLKDNVLQKVRAIVTDNGSDAIAAGNYFVNLCKERCSEDPNFQPCWLIRCVDHNIQLAVNEALRFVNQINDKLRCILLAIRHSKTRREVSRKEAALRNQTSLEPPCLDSKTRWGSTHEMSSQSYD
uniref:DUF659 domain-containing protein n=1 Tax=Spongospora subterranea TaxID=70186 RepID=A0A0H5QJ29_9EUKA|eukprot:CRZ01296.1 hypothetical protein [Spongospora subterranea]